MEQLHRKYEAVSKAATPGLFFSLQQKINLRSRQVWPNGDDRRGALKHRGKLLTQFSRRFVRNHIIRVRN